MKKIDSKGFTLIELLAVITILGILMLVAIPAVSRTIENSRRDTFADNAKNYINTVRNAVLADELSCTGYSTVSATPDGTYYVQINTKSGETGYQSTSDLMEKVARSPWGGSEIIGYVKWVKTTSGEKTITKYYAYLTDTGKHGMEEEVEDDQIARGKISAAVAASKVAPAAPTDTGAVACTVK